MSSTGRKKQDGTVKQKHLNDFYETPLRCTKSLLAVPEIHKLFTNCSTPILEPTAGSGAIIQAIDDVFPGKTYTAVELMDINCIKLNAFSYARDIPIQVSGPMSFLHWSPWLNEPHEIGITNPPFTIWEDIWEHTVKHTEHTFFLLRLGVLGSRKRFNFWKKYKPNLYVLEYRPSFTEDGKTDSDYVMWVHNYPGARGRYEVIE